MSFHDAQTPEDLPRYKTEIDDYEDGRPTDDPVDDEVQDAIDAERDIRNETYLRNKDRAGLL